MRRHPRQQMFTALLAALCGGILHLATPLALFAQSGATASITVRVMPADAAWAAQGLEERLVERLVGHPDSRSHAPSGDSSGEAWGVGSRVLAEPGEESGAWTPGHRWHSLRFETGGVVAWVDAVVPPPEHDPEETREGTARSAHLARIMVAHLAN